MTNTVRFLTEFMENALSPYQARDILKTTLLEKGFQPLSEDQDWEIQQGGKYYVVRGASVIAFTVDDLDNFSYKIVASHLDSPALKLKENPVKTAGGIASLNTETYGGGLWYSFFDRPLKLAGQIVQNADGKLKVKSVVSPFFVTIPSQALHINREAGTTFTVNAQTDLAPVFAYSEENAEASFWQALAGEDRVVSHDLYVVNAQESYLFGVNNEFIASPRIDNLTSVCASLEAILSHANSAGVCVAAFFHHEEIGSSTPQGAGGDFMENTLRRIAYALRFDDAEYYKALQNTFLLSVDNAHGVHPAHPEKADPTNKTLLGGGIVIKNHASGAYITDAISSATVKTVFEKAGVPYQSFFNRSDMRSGSTLGVTSLRRFGVHGADIGIAQLAMHSACECFAKKDYDELINGLTAFFSTSFQFANDDLIIR